MDIDLIKQTNFDKLHNENCKNKRTTKKAKKFIDLDWSNSQEIAYRRFELRDNFMQSYYGIDKLLKNLDIKEKEQFMEEYAFDSIVPGICTKCGAVYYYEPDQDKGWCNNCNKNTVVSGLILLGVL